jgi:hypothetical protein
MYLIQLSNKKIIIEVKIIIELIEGLVTYYFGYKWIPVPYEFIHLKILINQVLFVTIRLSILKIFQIFLYLIKTLRFKIRLFKIHNSLFQKRCLSYK